MEEVVTGYQVFINHRGPDVKKTLASLIYHALKRSGLRVFLDQQELQAGDSLSSSIKTAISSASIHIAIFSPTYAESPWCLHELLWMLDCHGSKIIPIFCDIQPSDLRYIDKGAYADAFHNHRNKARVDIPVVECWIQALNKVSKISGLVFSKDKDDIGAFLDRVIDSVLKDVRREALDVATHPVGLDQAAEHFQNEVLKQTELSGIITVGIVGLGGSGKSTLVKHLYNLMRSQFNRFCFLSEVNKKELPALQQRLLHELLGCLDLHIANASQGKSLLRERLRGLQRVFIVFDEVDDIVQIESLISVKDGLGKDSLILVTSRDKDLLARSKVNLLYDVKLLNGKDAEELFCLHAFNKPIPPKGFEDLADEFVKICGGFPLALKVLGGQLSVRHDRGYWIRELENLHERELPDNIVENILKVSYNSLNRREKEVFLDVAHFLVGEDKDLAVRVLEGLDSSSFNCLETLQRKCLVEFDDERKEHKYPFTNGPVSLNVDEDMYTKQWRAEGSSKIRLHDLVRDMARQIAREEFLSSPSTKPFRLCLEEKMIWPRPQPGFFRVRGIRSDEHIKILEMPYKDLHISGLQLMVFKDSIVTQPFPFIDLSGDLVWLRLHKYNRDLIHTGISLRNLRVLELKGVEFENLARIYDCDGAPWLRELTVDCTGMTVFSPTTSGKTNDLVSSRGFSDMASKAELPFLNSFLAWLGKLRNLVKIVLKNMKVLTILPIDFENLRNLKHLDLSGWSDLKELPDSFTRLLQLEYLSLQDCSNLIFRDLGKICTLQYLNLKGCSLLEQLPRGTIAQRSLRYLNVMRTSVQQLPKPLGQLENLEQLLIGSQSLRTLPSSLKNLSRLTDLALFECSNLYDIRKYTEALQHLERLRICFSGVRILPELIVWRDIKFLDVVSCPLHQISFQRGLGKMPLDTFQMEGSVDQLAEVGWDLTVKSAHHNALSSLIILRIISTRISKLCIPDAEILCPNLEVVDLSNNAHLKEVDGLPCNLIKLNLFDCRVLKTVTCLSNMECLKFLNLSGCSGLEILNVQGLRSIEEIEADRCWNLQRIKGLGQLKKLSYLHISTGIHAPNNSLWSDILRFPSGVSTAILSGVTAKADIDKMGKDLRASDLNRFLHATIIDIPRFVERSLKVPLGDLSLHGAILLFLIADDNYDFQVIFRQDECHSYQIYRTFCSKVNTNTSRAYIFMWTQDSKMFKDPKFYGRAGVDCIIQPAQVHWRGGLPASWFRKGWMVTTTNKADGLELCKQFSRFLVM